MESRQPFKRLKDKKKKIGPEDGKGIFSPKLWRRSARLQVQLARRS
jgi:hypothetical protein